MAAFTITRQVDLDPAFAVDGAISQADLDLVFPRTRDLTADEKDLFAALYSERGEAAALSARFAAFSEFFRRLELAQTQVNITPGAESPAGSPT